ncbi:hypothetical protein BDZ85DRAFT_269854 [Elsinoe ampelina]|uniref:Uncharacterized protein n=1 Tax=Elsinoe ampelina TaxID=302913 RepID=A0A6A6FZU6_9PEZI|nr:hypothetical protein BDZ85DRAFT_269854 [Elsinoe ampelina]
MGWMRRALVQATFSDLAWPPQSFVERVTSHLLIHLHTDIACILCGLAQLLLLILHVFVARHARFRCRTIVRFHIRICELAIIVSDSFLDSTLGKICADSGIA